MHGGVVFCQVLIGFLGLGEIPKLGADQLKAISILPTVIRLERQNPFWIIWKLSPEWLTQKRAIYLPHVGGRIRLHKQSLSGAFLLNRQYNAHEYRFLKSLLKSGDTVIDVGANIGTISICMSQAVAPAGSVMAFEPDPITYKAMVENISLNKLGNVVPINAAVGKTGGFRDFCRLKKSSDMSHFLGNENGYMSRSEVIKVKCETIDDLFEKRKLKRVALLKIDVEGAELEVLQGATQVLANGLVDSLVVEMFDNNCANFGYRAVNIADFLSQYGYKPFEIINGERISIRPISQSDFPQCVNIFFVKDSCFAKNRIGDLENDRA